MFFLSFKGYLLERSGETSPGSEDAYWRKAELLDFAHRFLFSCMLVPTLEDTLIWEAVSTICL